MDQSTKQSELKRSKSRINILLIGEPHAGKSSFIASTRFATGDRSGAARAVERGNEESTTKHLQPREIVFKDTTFCFFDTRGYMFKAEKELELIDVLMGGVRACEELEVGKHLPSDPNNKIDDVLLFVSAATLLREENWLYSNKVTDSERYSTLRSISKLTLAKLGQSPCVVVTKLDVTGRKLMEDSVRKWLAPGFPKSNVYAINNYTEEEVRNKSVNEKTDQEIQALLEALKARQEVKPH